MSLWILLWMNFRCAKHSDPHYRNEYKYVASS